MEEFGGAMTNDETYMRAAIEEAMRASEINEVPVGAVAVVDGEIVSVAHNIREATANPLGHAELLLLEKLTKLNGDWRLENVTIYVTCEPCIMCTGALLQARIPRAVFGCFDPKAGACGSLYDLSNDSRLNHQIEVVSGVLADECGGLLKDFFRKLRN
jgi:tRNA(adenine34) deaminase